MKSECEMSNMNGIANMFEAEADLFDLSETVDNVDTVTENEETPVVRIPVPSAEEGTGKVEPVVIKVPEYAPPVALSATGPSAPQFWMPCRPPSLSAETLFDLALTVEAPDPARQMLGFFYETQLKRECKLLIPHPIPIYYRQGIWKALMIRRSNPDFFMCSAIDIVLTFLCNHFYPEDNDVFTED